MEELRSSEGFCQLISAESALDCEAARCGRLKKKEGFSLFRSRNSKIRGSWLYVFSLLLPGQRYPWAAPKLVHLEERSAPGAEDWSWKAPMFFESYSLTGPALEKLRGFRTQERSEAPSRIERAVSMKAKPSCINPKNLMMEMWLDGWQLDDVLGYFLALDFEEKEIVEEWQKLKEETD